MTAIDFGFSLNLLLAVAVVISLYWLWTRRSFYLFAWRFSGFMGVPIFEIIQVFGELFEETKSNSLCIWLGLYPVVLTRDLVLIEKVLASSEMLNKAFIYKPVYNVLEGGIISSPESEWRHNRRMINPSFRNQVLLSFMPIFNKAKNSATLKLEKMVDGADHKLDKMLKSLTMGIAVETTLGLNENDRVEDDMAEKFAYIQRTTSERIILTALHLDGINKFYKRYHQYVNDFKNTVYQLVMEKIENKQIANNSGHENIDQSSEEAVISMKKKPQIFIDQAIQIYQKKQLSWHDLCSESYTIMGAAVETSATSALSTLIMLAMHPEVQDRLFNEILHFYPEKTFNVEYEDLQQLPYLDMVINETLRLAPSVPLVGRRVIRDTKLGEHFFPKDMNILISIFHLHRRKDIWGPSADKFDPNNFLPDRMAEKHSYAYIPFSKGARHCIGWRYALMALKVLVIGLIRNYKFTTSFKYDNLYFVENIALSYLVEPAFKIEHRLE